MFTIQCQIMSRSGSYIADKTIKVTKNQFDILGPFLTKVNRLADKDSEYIQELLVDDEAVKKLIRQESWSTYDVEEETITEADEELKSCIESGYHSDEVDFLIHDFLEIPTEVIYDDRAFRLGKSFFYERYKGKDYEWTF